MISIFKAFISKVRVKYRLHKWHRDEHFDIGHEVKIFPETSASARLGYISIGNQTCIRGGLEIQREGGSIIIGNRCYIGDHTRIWAAKNIVIGDDVLIAHNVNIFDNDTHPTNYLERRKDADNIIRHGLRENFETLKSATVEIENDAWIGCNSIILKGVKIGRGAIVSAGSIVTKDVPPFTVVGGNPARVLKQLREE